MYGGIFVHQEVKGVLDGPITNYFCTDFQTRIEHLFKLCQDSSDLQNNYKSHVIQSLIGKIPFSSNTRK
jgi:hypothetical protein